MSQMIRGTDITLYTADGTETVGNVLIGEPANGGYTLAIPKCDTHDWTDRKIGFWGALWRTVGDAVQGIEANIPLMWNKKITVQRIVTNGTVTVYEADSFARHVFPDVLLRDLRGQTVQKAGEQRAGSLTVRIYAVCAGDGYVPRQGDLLIPASCGLIFDTSSEQAVSQSMAVLRQTADITVIRQTAAETVGTTPDIIIEAG